MLRRFVAVWLSAVVVAVPSVLAPSVAFAASGGGGEQGGVDVTNPGVGSNQYSDRADYACKDGQMFRNGVPFTLGSWPGCTGNKINDRVSYAVRECTTGYLVFRFYGTIADPDAGYTVSRVNLPEASGCPTAGNIESGAASPAKGAFFMMFTSPLDQSRAATQPWMKLNAADSTKLADDQYGNALETNVYKIVNTGTSNPLATNGKLLDHSARMCTAFARPALHQKPDFNPNSAYGSVVVQAANPSKGYVSFSAKKSYLQKINEWTARYVASRGQGSAVVGPELWGRFLGIPQATNALTAANVASAPGEYAQYPCGSPLNYQIQFTDILETDAKTKLPTVVSVPPKTAAPVNGAAYIPITRLYFAFRIDGKDSFGARADFQGQYAFERLSSTYAQNLDSACTVKDEADGAGRLCSSETVDQVYPTGKARTTSAVIRDNYRARIQSWLSGHFGDAGVPSYQVVNGEYPYQSSKADAAALTKWAKVFVNDQSSTLAVLPPCGADGTNTACDGTTKVAPDKPIPNACTTTSCEAPPASPTPCPGGSCAPVAPQSGKFVWEMKALPQPYLEVRSTAGTNASVQFQATPKSVWKSAQDAESFIDAQAQASTNSAYDSAYSTRQSWKSSNVGAKGSSPWAAAEFTSTKRADFSSARDWDIVMTYSGLGIDTYFPQCNTGDDTGCPPKATAWNQEPQLNSSCTTVGCYTPDDLKRVNVLPPSASLRASGYAVDTPWNIGNWAYQFYAATGKNKVVRLYHQSTALDVDVRYDAADANRASWYVGFHYQTWDPDYGPWYTVPEPCTKWEPTGAYFTSGPNAGLPITAPVASTCPSAPRRDIIGYHASGWKDASAGGSYTQYALADADSEVLATNGQQLLGSRGGANCAYVEPAGWNYCSPVLSGKVKAGN